MTELRIELFGAFRVVVDGHAVPQASWHRRKPAALVQLRKALHHARRALDGAADAPMIGSDVEDFRTAVAQARRTGDVAREPKPYIRIVPQPVG